MKGAIVHLLLIPALVLGALSCAPTAELALDTDATPSAELLRRVLDRSSALLSLTGDGTLTFDAPELSGSAAFSSSLKRPDSLLLVLEGPFGIDVGTVFLSREKYVVYNSMENSVMTGNPAGRSIRSVIPFDLTVNQMFDAFAGIFLPPQADGPPDRYDIDDGRFRLSYACGEERCEYWVDPAALLVTRYRRTSQEGLVILEASCSSLADDNGAVAPRKISIRFPREGRRLSIAYRSLSLNTDDLSFAFSVPPNARTINR